MLIHGYGFNTKVIIHDMDDDWRASPWRNGKLQKSEHGIMIERLYLDETR